MVLYQAFYGSNVFLPSVTEYEIPYGLEICLSELDTKDFLYMYITEEFHFSATPTYNNFHVCTK
jgi:hypothetical protein